MPSFLYSSTDYAKSPISHKAQVLCPPNKYNKPDSTADNQPSTVHFSAKLSHLAPSYQHSIAVYSQFQCPDRTCDHRSVLVWAYAVQPANLHWPWGRRYSSLCVFEGQAKEIHNVRELKRKFAAYLIDFAFGDFSVQHLRPNFLQVALQKRKIRTQ